MDRAYGTHGIKRGRFGQRIKIRCYKIVPGLRPWFRKIRICIFLISVTMDKNPLLQNSAGATPLVSEKFVITFFDRRSMDKNPLLQILPVEIPLVFLISEVHILSSWAEP